MKRKERNKMWDFFKKHPLTTVLGICAICAAFALLLCEGDFAMLGVWLLVSAPLLAIIYFYEWAFRMIL